MVSRKELAFSCVLISVVSACGQSSTFRAGPGGPLVAPSHGPEGDSSDAVAQPYANRDATDADPAVNPDGSKVVVNPSGETPSDTDGTSGEAFSLDALTSGDVNVPIDVVMVVDNSTSMAEEAAQVRQHIHEFMGTLSDRRDLKVILLSETADKLDTGVTLTDADKAQGHVQIAATVGSYGAPAVAAAAGCFSGLSKLKDGGPDTVCGFPVKGLQTYDRQGVSNARGKLTSVFRPGAQRTYVFVSDDNSLMNEVSFLAATKLAGAEKPVVYGFVGTKSSTCHVDAKGSVYENLAKTTGGIAFDICQSDWNNDFSRMSQRILSSTETTFKLKYANVTRVKEVRVDGKAVNQDQYKIEAGVLKFNVGVITAEGQKVEIEYFYKTSKKIK